MEEFVEAVICFPAIEQDKKRMGKKTFYDKIHNSFFRRVQSHDESVPQRIQAAEMFFKMADTNKNGKVEREEFISLRFNLMSNPDNVKILITCSILKLLRYF